MSLARIRVGIIGANTDGSWGAIAHLPALRMLPDFEVVGVATTRRETAVITARQFGIPQAFGDPRELVEHPDVDLVVVCVRVPFHHELVMAAINAGKHVFCEWPLDVDLAQAQRLRDAAVHKGVRHVVGLQARASAGLNFVRAKVAAGYVGKLLSCNLIYSQPWPSRVPRKSAYLQDRGTGATMFTIYGGHCLEALRYGVGPFRELSATIATQVTDVTVVDTGDTIKRTSPDEVIVNGVLENGAVASVHIQGAGPAGTGLRFEITGSERTLLVTCRGAIHIADLKVSEMRGDGPLTDLLVPASYQIAPVDTPSGPPMNVAGLYVGLSGMVTGGTQAVPDFDTAVNLHRLLETIQTASETGIRQTL